MELIERRKSRKHRKSSRRASCKPVKVRGNRYRNPCTGKFTRKPRK